MPDDEYRACFEYAMGYAEQWLADDPALFSAPSAPIIVSARLFQRVVGMPPTDA